MIVNLKFRMLSALLALVLILPLLPVVSFAAEERESALNGPWDGSVAEAYAGGTGVSGDPYQIATPAQLALMAAHLNSADAAVVNRYVSAHYVLTADIDLGNREWTPIGGNLYQDYSDRFKGVFDGAGHTISNLSILQKQPDGAGLFGVVAAATIKNFTLQGRVISGLKDNSTTSAPGIAMLASTGHGTKVENLTVYSNVCVKSSDEAWGIQAAVLFGYAASGTSVKNCKLYGTIEVKHSQATLNVGAVAGRVRSISITNVLSDVDIYIRDGSTSHHMIGGLIGRSDSDPPGTDKVSINGCSVTGNLHVNSASGTVSVGGLAGAFGFPTSTNGVKYAGLAEIHDCSFDGDIYVSMENLNGTAVVNKGSMAGLMQAFTANISNFFTSSTEPFYMQNKSYPYGSGNDALTINDQGGHVSGISVASDFGVAVRLTSHSTGLRFNSLIKSDLYSTLSARNDLTVKLGTLITPTAYVEAAGAFTTERLDSFAKSNGYGVGYIDVEFIPGTHEWLDSYIEKPVTGYHYFSGAISNIVPQNYNRTFSGLGYVSVTANGYTHTFYADYTDAARSRTVGYVANCATNDRKDVQDDIYRFLTEDGDYSPYSATQRANIKAYVDAYEAEYMNTESLKLVENGASDYAIVYPFAAEGAEFKLAAYLKHVIKSLTGVDLPVREDLASSMVIEKEIVIGSAERADAYHVGAANYASDYSVTTSGKRVVILGNDEASLTQAVLAFVQECFGIDLTNATTLTNTANATVTLPRFTQLLSSDENTIKPLSLSISGYRIVRPSSTTASTANAANYMINRMAVSLQESYNKEFGTTLSLTTSSVLYNRITFKNDTSLKNGAWKLATTKSGSYTVITISAGSYYGFEGAEDFLLAALRYGFAPVTTSGFVATGNYVDWVGSGVEEVTKYAYQDSGTMRVMFYNVLWNETQEGIYKTPTDQRNLLQTTMIAQYMPDVLALQEFNATRRGNAADGKGGMVSMLESYGYAETIDPRVKNLYATDTVIPGTEGYGHLTQPAGYIGANDSIKGYGTGGTSVTVNGETFNTFYNCTPLFYNKETTICVKSEYYWYKSQWNRIEVGEDGKYIHENSATDCASKAATWGLFQSKATGQKYIVIGTHMCTRSDMVRGLQAQELVALIATLTKQYNVPVFLGGDLNGSNGKANYDHFISPEVGYTDLANADIATLFSSEVNSTHGYPTTTDMTNGLIQLPTGKNFYNANSIDRILMTNENQVTIIVFGVVIDECTLASSDHCPVFCDVFISKYGSYTNKY